MHLSELVDIDDRVNFDDRVDLDDRLVLLGRHNMATAPFLVLWSFTSNYIRRATAVDSAPPLILPDALLPQINDMRCE